MSKPIPIAFVLDRNVVDGQAPVGADSLDIRISRSQTFHFRSRTYVRNCTQGARVSSVRILRSTSIASTGWRARSDARATALIWEPFDVIVAFHTTIGNA